MRLFNEPFELDAIDKILRDDFARFSQVAFFALGTQGAWRAGLDQVDRLLDAYAAAGRNDKPVWQLVVLLVHRAETFDDTGAFLDELSERLCILPGTTYFELIRLAHLHKTDPRAWQKAQYRAQRDQIVALSELSRIAGENHD